MILTYAAPIFFGTAYFLEEEDSMSILSLSNDFFEKNKNAFYKTLSYYLMHITVAAAVVYAVTKNFEAALTLSLLEPTVQCGAYFFHEKLWMQLKIQKLRALIKTLSYYCIHLSVAAFLVYIITGSWKIAFTLSLLEPTVQIMFFYFHEKLWDRRDIQKIKNSKVTC